MVRSVIRASCPNMRDFRHNKFLVLPEWGRSRAGSRANALSRNAMVGEEGGDGTWTQGVRVSCHFEYASSGEIRFTSSS